MPFRSNTQDNVASDTSSNVANGTMEQAGAGTYASGGLQNPASGAVGSAGVGAGATGFNTTAGDMVCVPGNVAAPVTVGVKTFTVVEDHAVQKERVERWVEHQPVEREYVTRVAEVGANTGGVYVDGAGGAERVVAEHTCFGTNTTTVHGVQGLQSTNANTNAIGANNMGAGNRATAI